MSADDPRRDLFLKFAADRRLAHEVLFKHRHSEKTPDFHGEMIDGFHSKDAMLEWIAFRGGAKSTIMEEGLVIGACFQEFHNCIIFGASEQLAHQRLHAIRREFEKNKFLRQLFGDLRGQPWSDEKLELSNGVVIQAMGRGQALRGSKEEVKRPDMLIFDDIESRESVRTPEGREKTSQWVLGEAIPMMDIHGRVRMLANDMDPECLANQLKKEGSGFTVKVYPWEYIDEQGQRTATWPERFPLRYIDNKKKQMVTLGRLAEYNREYMCKSSAPEDKPFKPDMMRVEPIPKTWHCVYVMLDPARTVGANSATTGLTAWSWIGNRLIVWEAWAKLLMPDEIVSSLFEINDALGPTEIAVEEDGLNEWLLQPIRQEQVKRGITLPLRAVKAPKGKMDFIRGLQPYFHAREVVFAKDLPDLKQQLLSFPTGRIDAPNALAYAPRLRPGVAIYDNFSGRNIVDGMKPVSGRPVWLVLNANGAWLAGQIVQVVDGTLRILADWVREGDPGELFPALLKESTLESGQTPRLAAHPIHWDRYNNFGLRQAILRTGMDLRKGTDAAFGREEVRSLLRKELRSLPAVLISPDAKWTCNGFAGGYARAMLKGGILAAHAEENIYRILMEGLEAFAGLSRTVSPDEEEDGISYDVTAQGRRFISARR